MSQTKPSEDQRFVNMGETPFLRIAVNVRCPLGEGPDAQDVRVLDAPTGATFRLYPLKLQGRLVPGETMEISVPECFKDARSAQIVLRRRSGIYVFSRFPHQRAFTFGQGQSNLCFYLPLTKDNVFYPIYIRGRVFIDNKGTQLSVQHCLDARWVDRVIALQLSQISESELPRLHLLR